MFHASDCLTPKGRLNGSALWPGVNLSVYSAWIEEYLTEGYGKAGSGQDESARWWAYYRAWDDKWQTLSAMPASVSVSDKGSSGYTQTQIDSWRTMALEALGEFEALTPAEEDGSYRVITSLR